MRVSQFKCYVCRSIITGIPYCGECEIALPNSIRVGYTLIADEAPVLKPKKKKPIPVRIRSRDEDDDLFNDFENKKAAAIRNLKYRKNSTP